MSIHSRVFLALATLSLMVAAASSGVAEDYQALIDRAGASSKQRDFASAVTTYRAAFQIHDDRGMDLYNAACAAAQAGDTSTAFAWLRRSLLEATWNVPLDAIADHVSKDADLLPLHDSDEWKKLLDDLGQRVAALEAKRDRPLQAELEAIFASDQGGRSKIADTEKQFGRDSEQMRALWKTISEQDATNLAKVAAILDKRGWVGPQVVGDQASATLFLVIQHADLAAQEKYLPLMRAAVKRGDARPADLALLEDRVAIREGHPQIYGSQIGRDAKTGEWYVEALADPDHVDERRASVGLQPLSEYIKMWNLRWDVDAYKKQLPELVARLHPEK